MEVTGQFHVPTALPSTKQPPSTQYTKRVGDPKRQSAFSGDQKSVNRARNQTTLPQTPSSYDSLCTAWDAHPGSPPPPPNITSRPWRSLGGGTNLVWQYWAQQGVGNANLRSAVSVTSPTLIHMHQVCSQALSCGSLSLISAIHSSDYACLRTTTSAFFIRTCLLMCHYVPRLCHYAAVPTAFIMATYSTRMGTSWTATERHSLRVYTDVSSCCRARIRACVKGKEKAMSVAVRAVSTRRQQLFGESALTTRKVVEGGGILPGSASLHSNSHCSRQTEGQHRRCNAHSQITENNSSHFTNAIRRGTLAVIAISC
jgi:hypothetical protein